MRTTEIITILAAQIAASSWRCIAAALVIVTQLLSDTRPGIAQWRERRPFLGSNTPSRDRVVALVDSSVKLITQEILEGASTFDTLTEWISATPHEWIRWHHLPSWGQKPDFDFLASWDHDSRRCLIGDPLGQYQLSTYVEVESLLLKEEASTAYEDLEENLDDFRSESWTVAELLDVAEQLNAIEDHLDDAYPDLSVPCRMGAGDYLQDSLMEAIEDVVTVDGYHLTPPNKCVTAGSCAKATLLAGGKGWDVEPKKTATQESLHAAKENTPIIGD